MVSVVSGAGLGWLNSSRNTVGAGGELGQAMTGRAGEQVIVNAATGNLVVSRRDEQLVGIGTDIALFRTYNSQGGWDGDNNDAWRLGFYRRLAGLTGTVNTAGSTLRRVEADGSESVFTFRDGRYVTPDGAGAYDTLVVNASAGTATWTDGDSGVTESYQTAGAEAGTWRLTQVTDPDGHAVRVSYASTGLISTLASRKAGASADDETVTLVYDANKRLTQLDTTWRNDSAQQAVRTLTRYTYDSASRLQSVITDLTPDDRAVTDAKTYVVTYGYDSAGRLSSLTQTDGSSLAITYDTGRVKTITDALGRVTTFSYDTANRKTTVTDARGQAAVLSYDTASRLTSLGGAVNPLTLSYDADGNVKTSSDGLNPNTTYVYDANGNLTRVTDASGRVTDSAFDTANRLTSQTRYTDTGTTGSVLTTRYVYDTTNGLRRLRFAISAEGRVTEQQFNSLGQVQARISYASNRFSGDATLAALATWAGQQPTTGAAVQRQAFTYDLRGAVRTSSDGRSTSTYIYDPFGRLLQTIDPQTGTTAYAYDGLDRLLLRTDTANLKTTYLYDDARRTASITWANGLRDLSTYDTAGQLITQAQFNGSTALGQSTLSYDAAGRLRMTVDPTGQRQWRLYDDAGRLNGVVDALGHLTETLYDAAGRAVLSTGYATAVDVSKLVDATGKPTDIAVATLRPADAAADRRQWTVYDTAGRPLWQVNSQGEATETRYDGAGRGVALVQHGQRLATLPAARTALALTALTALGTNASEPDHVNRNLYDNEGLLRGTLDAEGYLTELRYDAAGRLVERIAYATASPAAQRAAGTLAALTPAVNDDDRRSLAWYDAQGRTLAELDADGFLTEHTYNDAGQRTQTLRYATGLTLAAAKAAIATIDPATLRPAASTEDQRTRWGYDTLGRLKTLTAADGTVTQYGYDELGRIVRTDRALGTADQRSNLLRYDLQGRVSAELSALGASQLKDGLTAAQVDAIWAAHSTQHAYDAAGRRIRSTDAKGQVTLLYYDADGRVAYRIAKTALGGEVEGYRYNGFGEVTATQRYSKRLSTTDTTALQGGQASATLDQKVAALIDLSDQARSSFYNTVGRLEQVMDAVGNKTDYVYDAFGQLSRSTASIDADGGKLRRLVTQTVRDRRGLVTSTTQDPGGLAVTTRSEYDAFGRVTASIDGLGRRSTFKYTEGDGKSDGGRQVIITDATSAQRSTTYDAFDRVVRQTDALGNSVKFQYNTSARRLTLTTANGVVTVTDSNAHGQVVKLSDAQGTTTYEYDANGNRTRSTDALGNQVQDEFDAINRLTAHTVDPSGLKLKTTYEYDAANRVLAQRVDPDGLNLTTTFEYDAQGRAVRVTDAAGVITRYDFDGEGRLKTLVVDEAGLKLTTNTSYDAQGRVLTVRRFAGTTGSNASTAQVTEYHHDLLGRRIQEVVDPANLKLTTNYDYDAAGQLVRVSDTLGVRKRYVYDAAGRETYCIDALGGVERREYDAEGRMVRNTHYANAIATDGLPVAATSAQIQALLSPSAGADLVERRGYDKDDRLRFVIDALGDVSETRYDSLGRVSQTTAYAKLLSAVDLATAMNMATTTTQIGDLVAKGVDASRDRTTRFAYDGAGRLRFSVDAAGAVTETVYDKASRAIRTTQYAKTLAAGATIQAPTADAARDRSTRTVYDAAGRAVQQVDAEGYLTANQYDRAGNLATTLRYASRVQRADALTQGARVSVLSATATPPDQGAYLLEDSSLTNITNFQYDGLNRRTLSIDVEQHYEVSVYNDALGASVQRYNVLGGVATLVYDTVGRLVQETLPVQARAADGTLVAVVNRHEYDVRGNRIKSIEAVGLPEERTTQYRFDALNRMVRRIGMAFSAVDAAGITSLVTPVDVYSFNALGQLTDQTAHAVLSEASQPGGATTGGRTSRAYYDLAGRKTAELSADFVLSRFSYDGTGNLLAQTVSGGASPDRTLRFAYDPLGRKTATQLDGVWTWELGQPVSVNGVPAAAGGAGSPTPQTLTLEQLQYDAFGNVVRRTDARGNASYAYYDKLSRKQLEIDAGGYAVAWDYDRPGATATRETRYARAVPIAYGVQGSGTTAPAVRTALAQLGADPASADRVTQFTLDRLGRVTRREVLAVTQDFSSSGAATELTFAGVATALTDYVYDGLGHVTKISELVGARPAGQKEQRQDTNIGYDLLGREIRRENPTYFNTANTVNFRPATDTEYDGLGQVRRSIRRGLDNSSEADDRITTYSYDGLGRVFAVVDAEGNMVRHSYDANGDKVRQTYAALLHSNGDRRDQVKTFRYDNAGRLIETIDQDTGESTQLRYNAFGEVTAQGSNGGYQEWFEYDAMGKVWKTNSGDGTAKFYLHDANGNLTRELRVGLGSSTTRDLRDVTLAEVLAEATLVSTVYVYDARNLQVRTIVPRMTRLANEATLAQQFTETWAPQWGDLNGNATGLSRTTVTTGNGARTPLTGGIPGTAPGGTGNTTGAAASKALPFGAVATFALDLPSIAIIMPTTTAAVTQAVTALEIPSSWPVGHFRVKQTINGKTTELTVLATAGSKVLVGAGATTNCLVDIEWQPTASSEWQPIAQLSLAKTTVPGGSTVTFTWTKITHSDNKVFVDLAPGSSWGGASRFTLLLDPDDPARATTVLAAQRLLGDRIGVFDLSTFPIATTGEHQIQLLAFQDGQLVGGRKFKITGTAAGTLVDASGDATVYAGSDGTAWAQNTRKADGSRSFSFLSWDLGSAHAGDGTLRWRKAGATADPWTSSSISSSPAGSSSMLIGSPGTAIADGSYYFVLEQGDARVTGVFTLTGGVLTVAENRLKPMTLPPERITINGPVDSQGRGRVALTVGSTTVIVTTDANGQATFDLSQIRQLLGLDRWSVASQPFSYVGYLDFGNNQRQFTHAEHGTLALRAPRVDGNETFQFTADASTEYEAEAVITVPSKAGTVKLTPVGGTDLTLTLGSDWRLVLSGNDVTVNLDGLRPAWGAADQLVDWSFTGSDGKTANGRLRITDKGVTTRENAASGTPKPELRLTSPSGVTAVALTLALDNGQTAQLSPASTSNGTRVYDLKAYLPTSGSKTLSYTFQTSGVNGVGLTRGAGQITLAADGTITSTAFDERRAITVALRIDGVTVPKAKLNVSGVGNVTLTGTWVPAAQVTNPDGTKTDAPGATGYTRFDWDASSVSQSNGPSTLSYTLTPQDANGATQGTAQTGRIVLDPNNAVRPVQIQQQVTLLNLGRDFAVSVEKSYNAFGDQIEERDERVAERTQALLGRELTPLELANAVTTYTYNTLGKLVQRVEAQSGVTADNGFAFRDRAVTNYGYDLLGRLNTQTDANGIRTVRRLLDGPDDSVVRQITFRLTDLKDGKLDINLTSGDRFIDYNNFGEAVRIEDEANHVTKRVYDRMGRLIQVNRSVERLIAKGIDIDTHDEYVYDALGQLLKHAQYAGQTARPNVIFGADKDDLVTLTDYDGLGRVVATVSAAGFKTGYTYATVNVTGLNGFSVTGTRKTTQFATGMKLVDETDYFNRTTMHADLSGVKTTYTYDAAARLLLQTSAAPESPDVVAGQLPGHKAGQNIRYAYFANGAIKSQIDATLATCTDYTYDDTGNRTGEAYYTWNNGQRVGTFQSNTIVYDERNRVARVADGTYYSVRYEYDAVGNRRLIDASYADGTKGPRQQQTYWYTYDVLNQLRVSKGMLAGVDGLAHARGTSRTDNSATIIAGTDGVELLYDGVGQRLRTIYTFKDPTKPDQPAQRIVETYKVDGDGHVLELKRIVAGAEVDVLKRDFDLAGRLFSEEESETKKITKTTYDKDNRLLEQKVGDMSTKFFYDAITGGDHNLPDAGTATGAGALFKTVKTQGTQTTTTTYQYEYWDDARQKLVKKEGPTGSGSTLLTYNANGHLVSTNDSTANLKTTFFTSANGQVLQRERQQNNVAVGSHVFFYADGKRVGDIRNDPSDNAHLSWAEELALKGQTPPDNTQLFKTFKPVVVADFDQNYEPINSATGGGASTSYTVRAGDTLPGLALQLWGDSSLWYLIAEANGLNGIETLSEGRVLQIPTRVTNIHHSTQTIRPYNPGEAIGHVDPTLPTVQQKDLRCGTLSVVIGAVVTVVASMIPGAGAYVAPALGDMARQYSFAAFNGQLDWKHFLREGMKLSMLSSLSPTAAGLYLAKNREHPPGFNGEAIYDYKSTLIAGVVGAVSGGIGQGAAASGIGRVPTAVLQGYSAGMVSQGLSVLSGQSNDFNWQGLLASTVGAGVGAQASEYLGTTDWGKAYGGLGARVGGGYVGGVVAQRLLPREQRDYPGVFASTLGSVIGDSIVGAMTSQDPLGDFINQKLAEQGRRDLYGPAGVPVAGAGLGYRTSGPGVRLSEQAVADWSNDVDSGIGDASRALVNFDGAAGRAWGQEDAQAALDGRAALLRQHVGADAYRRELAAQRAADERLRLDTLIASGGPRGGAGVAYGDVLIGSSPGGSRITSTIDGMPSTSAYQIVANVDERGVPVSYGAYNKVTGQTDYLIGPTGLGEFMTNSKAMTIEAYYRHKAAEARPYERASGQFVMEALNGNLGAAGSAYASSWGEAVQDPHWLASTSLALVGGVVGNAGRTGAADYLSQFSSTELSALRTAGLSDAEIARHVQLSGDVHLFRGTSPGWAGSPGAQATAVSATTDPYIATVFALEARGQAGQAVVQFGPRSSIGTFDVGNWMAAQEREVGVLMTSRDFAARAPGSVPVDAARQVLGEMGMPALPHTVASPSARSMLLDAAPKMTPEQVAEFLQRINKTGPR